MLSGPLGLRAGELNLRLTAAGDKLFHPEFSVLVIQNDTEHDHPFDRSLFYHGTVDGEPHALVSAYVDDDVSSPTHAGRSNRLKFVSPARPCPILPIPPPPF